MMFEPVSSPLFTTTAMGLIVAALSAAALFYLLRTNALDSKYRQLLSMLTFFVLLIAVGISVFNWIAGERIDDLKIEADGFDTAYGFIPFEEVKDIVIFIDQEHSPLTPQHVTKTEKRLLIITVDDKTYPFSEAVYPVQEMIGPMREAWENKSTTPEKQK